MVFSLILIPTLVLLYNERMSIFQERKAIHLLDKTITSWVYDESDLIHTEVNDLGTTYKIVLSVDEASQHLKACITWKAANDRQYERCESGKK